MQPLALLSPSLVLVFFFSPRDAAELASPFRPSAPPAH
jgi:hypothetical protein